MATLSKLIKRNVSLFFKDKGMFFCSLISPLILLVLYTTFLADVFRDAFLSGFPPTTAVEDSLVDGFVAGQLLASILAVSCITVAFCANTVMVQDKYLGVRQDFLISPVKQSVLSLSYFFATLISTLIICFVATAACFIYTAIVGWYLSFTDLLLIILDVIILSTFGTALSTLINLFVSTQGQTSAVSTIVSACYGFISGAYMPISTFGDTLKTVLGFLPGTYGTSLIKRHSLAGALREMKDMGVPQEVLDGVGKSVDCTITMFDKDVKVWLSYLIIVGSLLLLIGAILIISRLLNKKGVKK